MVLSSTLGYAQTKPTSPAGDADTVITLTPFEVTATEDQGYQATETLAGTRIRTDLRDVGSAISVATKEFMRDIGATNNLSLLTYMTNTEVGGPGGNFGGIGSDSVPNDNASRLNPNGNTRVRGLSAADNTRDFYLTDIPWDSYNTSRVDIQRGANSILFGNGSGGGIINAATDAATLGVNSTEVQLRYGSFGSYRGSINLNRDLIPKELAIRFASLYNKDYFRQDPAYSRDQRYYGALRWEPSFLKKGSARTSVKVSYETGDIDANRPRINTPLDGITPWFRTAAEEMRSPTPIAGRTSTGNPDGGDEFLLGVLRPMLSHAGYDPFVTGISDATLLNSAAAQLRMDVGARASYNANTARTSEAWLARSTGPGISGGWTGLGAIYDQPGDSLYSSYIASTANGAFQYNGLRSDNSRDGNVNGLRGLDMTSVTRFDFYTALGVGGRTTANDGFLFERQGVYRAKSITDPTVFDFYNKLIDGPNKKETANFEAFNFVLDQTFLDDRVGFQVAYDNQTYRNYQSNILNSDATITIDAYKYLPIAMPDSSGILQPVENPNFGRPFIASTAGGSRFESKREVFRVTPFAIVDFKSLMKQDNIVTKILGKHTFTGLLEGTDYSSDSRQFQRYAISDANSAAIFGPNQPLGFGIRNVSTVNYLGDSLATAPSLAGANLANISGLRTVNNGSAWYFDSTYRSGAPAASGAWALGSSNGLGANQNNLSGTNLFNAENPANYNGWGTAPRTVSILNADSGDEAALTTSDTLTHTKTKSWALIDQWTLLNRLVVLTGGVRKDKIESLSPGQRLKVNQAVDWDAPLPKVVSSTFTSDLLKTYSIVVHTPEFINKRLPWGLKGSVFYNVSDNFQPGSRNDIFAKPIPPPTGDTKEIGIVISALDGRVSLKINKYDTNVINASLQDNSIIAFTGDEVNRGLQFALGVKNHGGTLGGSGPGFYAYTNTADTSDTRRFAYQPLFGTSATWTTADWEAADALAQSHADAFLAATLGETEFLTAWGLDGAPGKFVDNTSNFSINRTQPTNLAVTGDTHSEGYEYELFLRPTDNWNVAINASKTSAQRLNLAGSFAEWMDKRWALYDGPAGQLRWFGGGNNGGGGVIGDFGQARFGRNGYRWYSSFLSQEGNDAPELRPWRFNAITSYRFTEGALKGAFVGASYRWQDKDVIGYGVKQLVPALGSVNPALGGFDITKPYYGERETALDLWLGFEKKLSHGVNWRIQLNVQNALGNLHLTPINTNPDGSGASYRIVEGSTWSLTNTFKF